MDRVCQCLIMMSVIVLCLDAKGKSSRDGLSVDFFSLSKNFTIMIQSDFDVLMTIDQYKQLRASNRRTRVERADVVGSNKYWPYGIVYYEFTEGVEPYRIIIKLAFNHWETFTCLKFNESTSARTRVKFVLANVCTSPYGFGNRVIEVGVHPSCITVRNIIHEIGHIVGMIHEHNRPDRDDYIKLQLEKVPPRMRLYFDKYKLWDLHSNINVGYDYASIMHLSNYNGIVDAGDPRYQDMVGKGQGLSFRDIKHIHYMYQCDVVARCKRRACPFNGFVFCNPLHGMSKCQCVCDSGFLNDPLRLCSTLFSEFPAPMPFSSRINVANVLDNALESSTCADVKSNCAALRERGFCRIEVEVMYTECAKTCGFCDKGKDMCMDFDYGCHMMATSGVCDDGVLNETMRIICPKSCGWCTNTNSPCDIEHLMTEPANGEHRMQPPSATVLLMVIIAAVYCL